MNATDGMYVSLNQAAKIWNKSKGTISKMAKDGRLQWHPQADGTSKLLLSQLAHYFGEPPQENEREKQVSERVQKSTDEQSETTGNAIEISRLMAELKAAHEKIELIQTERQRERGLLESQLERERKNADGWQHTAEQSQAMLKVLPAPANNDRPSVVASSERPGFLARLLGKSA